MLLRARKPLTIALTQGSQHVVFKLKTTESARRALGALATTAGMRAEARRGPLAGLLGSKDVAGVEPLFPPETGRRARGAEKMVLALGEEEEAELAGLNVLQARSPEAARRASEGLRRDPRVEYSHVIQERYLYAAAGRAGARRRRADQALDPMQNRQWGLGAVKLSQAQQSPRFREARDVVIAVIDTGVDSGHPDLAGILVEERNFTSGTLRDTKGHGTHVIGIIAAVRNNRIGISGVCQSRKIMSLKALGPYSGPGYYRAIRHATDNGAQVINLSLGGSHDPTEELLIRRALRRGVAVVAAMGNEFEEGNPTSYPAAIPGVIAVGASTEVDGRASFSNTGRHIDLVAPGVNILSTVPTYPSELAETESYDSWPGTSMATPFVTATAALLLATRPRATVARVRRALTRGTERVPGQTGFNSAFGHGRLSVSGALARI